MDIRLEYIDGGHKEVLVGLPDDATQIDQAIVEAVRTDRRLFPHVICHLAGNLAINGTERLPAMIDVRNRLLEAIKGDGNE